MLGHRNEIAALQSDFYRDKFRRILRWLTVSVLVMFLLILTMIYLVLFRGPIDYYANTTDGKIISMPVAVEQ